MGNVSRATLFLVLCVAAGFFGARLANAITPPTPTQPKQATVVYAWVPPVLRADLVTPLPANERKESRLYITSLSAFITVPELATSYTYVVPWGQCIKSTDGAQVTAVDTLNQESAASNIAFTATDACSVGKPLPKAPTGVTATVN